MICKPLDYWDSWSTLVEITLNEMQEQTEREVARRMERARWLLNKRFEDLPREAQDSYFASRPKLSGFQVSSGRVFVPWPCPVCMNQAFVVAGPPVHIGNGKPGESLSEKFFCLACNLTLKDHEMLVVGIPQRIPLMDAEGKRLMTDAEERLWQFFPSNNDEAIPD
jgi:hypothetical protein